MLACSTSSEQGPYKPISASGELRQTLSVQTAGEYTWFRVVSVSGHGLRADPSAARENIFQSIVTLYDAEDYDGAVKLADKLLKIAPDNADARDLLAMSLFRQQDYSRAINEFRTLSEVGPYRIKAIQYQVQAYFELGQFLDARSLIDQVLDLSRVETGAFELSPKVVAPVEVVEVTGSGLPRTRPSLHPRGRAACAPW